MLCASDIPGLGLNFFDYGIAVGVILCLFFIVWFGGRHVLEKFEKISRHHDDTIRAISEQHREERKEWRDEANDRVAHINELLEKTLDSLRK